MLPQDVVKLHYWKKRHRYAKVTMLTNLLLNNCQDMVDFLINEKLVTKFGRGSRNFNKVMIISDNNLKNNKEIIQI